VRLARCLLSASMLVLGGMILSSACSGAVFLGGDTGDAGGGSHPVADAPSEGAAFGSNDAGACPSSGSTCIDDLSNIGTADFQISFVLTTTWNGSADMAVISQRAHCDHGMFWDVRIDAAGQLDVETDDALSLGQANEHYSQIWSTSVADGKPHCIQIERKAQVLTTLIDGVVSASGMSLSSFGQLPALSVMSDACDGTACTTVPNFGMICGDGSFAFVGTLTNICVASP
jgi:hypothetical protein